MTSLFHLAQVNIGRARGEMTDPVMAEFVANLPEINALADHSPGFVWRLQTEDGDATAVRPYADTRDPHQSFRMGGRAGAARLRLRSAHAGVMRRRREWFERFERIYVALWWVPAGHRPSVAEAVERLAHLERHGPTPFSFSFREAVRSRWSADPTRGRDAGRLLSGDMTKAVRRAAGFTVAGLLLVGRCLRDSPGKEPDLSRSNRVCVRQGRRKDRDGRLRPARERQRQPHRDGGRGLHAQADARCRSARGGNGGALPGLTTAPRSRAGAPWPRRTPGRGSPRRWWK